MENSTTGFQKSILNQLNKKLEIEMTAVENMSLAISKNNDLHEVMKGIDHPNKRTQTVTNVTNSIEDMTFSEPIIDSIDIFLEHPPIDNQERSVHYDHLQDILTSGWYDRVKNSDFSWVGEHTIVTSQGKTPVVSFNRKLYNSFGMTQGFLVINLKVDDFRKMFQGEGVVSNLFLLDAGGYPIVANSEDELNQTASAYLNQIEKLGDQAEQNGSGAIHFQNNLVVWNRSFQSDWVLIEVTPWNEISNGSFRMAIIFSFFGLITIIVALLLTLYLSKQFTRPIFELVQHMKYIPKEFCENRLPEDYQNEFGALYQGYNHMVKRIVELYQSLDKQYQKQKQAEIKALQAMINPHFLYNTLDQINWMAIAAGHEQISTVLELMGKMLRIGLSNGESLITIREELLHLEYYMKIQQIRLGNEITYKFDVPVDLQHFYIPKLTFQPFVENSILHGFHGKQQGNCTIKISQDQEFLNVLIADNGQGFPQTKQEHIQHLGGYGIRNVKERLNAYFGSSCDIQIKSVESMGTKVTFRLPKISAKENFGGMHYVENSNH